jgi:hypothetical protein
MIGSKSTPIFKTWRLRNCNDLAVLTLLALSPTPVRLFCDTRFATCIATLQCACFILALAAHSGPWPLVQFRNHFTQTVGLLGRVIRPSRGLYLNTGQHKHRINAYTHRTSMLWVGFEPTIPASERAKAVHTLDRAATVTGKFNTYWLIYIYGGTR